MPTVIVEGVTPCPDWAAPAVPSATACVIRVSGIKRTVRAAIALRMGPFLLAACWWSGRPAPRRVRSDGPGRHRTMRAEPEHVTRRKAAGGRAPKVAGSLRHGGGTGTGTGDRRRHRPIRQ